MNHPVDWECASGDTRSPTTASSLRDVCILRVSMTRVQRGVVDMAASTSANGARRQSRKKRTLPAGLALRHDNRRETAARMRPQMKRSRHRLVRTDCDRSCKPAVVRARSDIR